MHVNYVAIFFKEEQFLWQKYYSEDELKNLL